MALPGRRLAVTHCRFHRIRRLGTFRPYFIQLNRDWNPIFQLIRRLDLFAAHRLPCRIVTVVTIRQPSGVFGKTRQVLLEALRRVGAEDPFGPAEPYRSGNQFALLLVGAENP